MAIIVNDNFQSNSPKHIDAKYMKFTGGQQQPYASPAEAVSTILSAYRYKYLTVLCLMNGDPVEYWWQIDTTDASLLPKSKESYNISANGSITPTPGYLYDRIVILPTVNIASLLVGTSNGASDIEPGTAITAGSAYTISYPKYINAATSFWFTGVTANTKVLFYKTF